MTSPSEEYSDEDLLKQIYGNRVSITTGSGAFRYRDVWLDRDGTRPKCLGSSQNIAQAWKLAVKRARVVLAIGHSPKPPRQFIFELKNEVPCLDCGGRFPNCAMEFDHVRGEKRFTIGNGVGRSIEELKEEIAKCDLVCANCHRIRHHVRHRKLSVDLFQKLRRNASNNSSNGLVSHLE